MKLFRHTEIIEIKTCEQLELLICCLTELKSDAPKSLTLQMSITVERALEGIKSAGEIKPNTLARVHPGTKLRELAKTLSKQAEIKPEKPEIKPSVPKSEELEKPVVRPKPKRKLKRSARAVER